MGSFSYTCHLSGLPITSGTPCVILPMLPKTHWGYDCAQSKLINYGKGSLVSNDGANLYFEEMCFPIFGTYNDYGGIEDIEQDDNTKFLEKFFELPIETIAEVLCDGRRDEWQKNDNSYTEAGVLWDKKNKKPKHKNHSLLIRSSITWYRRDVYDKLTSSTIKSWDYSDRLDIGVHGVLTALGFTWTNPPGSKKEYSNNEKDRYYRTYEKGKVKINSDGNWINLSLQKSIYSVDELKEWVEKKGETLDITPFEGKGMWAQVYDFILPHLKSLGKGGDRWETDRVIRMLLGDEYKIKMRNLDILGMDDDDGDLDDENDFLNSLLSSVPRTLPMIEKDLEAVEEKYRGAENVSLDPLTRNKRYAAIKKDKEYIALKKELGKMQKQIEKFNDWKKAQEIKRANTPDLIAIEMFKMIKEEGNNFLRKNIIDWFKVKDYYYPCGRFLYPIGTSNQDGGHGAVLQLLTIAKDCLTAEMKNNPDRFGEDDEEN